MIRPPHTPWLFSLWALSVFCSVAEAMDVDVPTNGDSGVKNDDGWSYTLLFDYEGWVDMDFENEYFRAAVGHTAQLLDAAKEHTKKAVEGVQKVLLSDQTLATVEPASTALYNPVTKQVMDPYSGIAQYFFNSKGDWQNSKVWKILRKRLLGSTTAGYAASAALDFFLSQLFGGQPMSTETEELLLETRRHHAELFRVWMEVHDAAHSLPKRHPDRERKLMYANELRTIVDAAQRDMDRLVQKSQAKR